MKSDVRNFFDKIRERYCNSLFILFFLSFLLWIFAFRGFLFNKLALVGDARAYFEHFHFYLDNIGRGVFPMWETARASGVPIEFFLRRIGEFNPLFFLILTLNKIGLSFTSSYLIFLAFYYFLGMVGFYLLAKRVFGDSRPAFAAYLLLLFSSLGTRLFDSFIIGIFVPMIWFFYFLTAFTQSPKRHFLLGVTFTLMIIVTTYVPFYFLTVFGVFVICFSVIYFRNLREIFWEYLRFFKVNKLFSCFCILALLLSLIPGILFYQESARGEYVLPVRHAGSLMENSLGVRFQTIGGGGVVSPLVRKGLFSNLRQFQVGTFYIPVFAYLLLLFGGITPINKRLVLLGSWGFGIYLISLNNATPLYRFLYDHVFYFKYFRNFEFFLWVILLPIGVFFVAEQLRLFLNYQPRTKKEKYAVMALVFIIHLALAVFIYGQGDDLISSYLVVGLSLFFFMLYLAGTLHQNIPKLCILLFFFILILAQPMEVYKYLNNNAVKGGGPYRYKNINSYLLNFSLPDLIDESRTEISDYPFKQAPGIMYYGTKWYYLLYKNLNYNIFEEYIGQGFIIVYDRVVWANDDSPDINIKRIARVFAGNYNVAFVSDKKAIQNQALPPLNAILALYKSTF